MEERLTIPNAKVHIVLNPASAAGRTGARSSNILDSISRTFGHQYSVHTTRSQSDATQATAEAIKNGSGLVIAIGGDGTIHEVVNGFFENGEIINPECELGIIGSGSGCDIAKNLGLPQSLEEQILCCSEGTARKIDLGRVTFLDSEGRNGSSYFVNECQVGIGGEVVRRVQRFHKRFGGTLAFALESVRALFQYQSPTLTLRASGNETMSDTLLGLVIANGALMGGGMKLAPYAQLNDGLFDVLVIPDFPVLRRLSSFLKIYRGTHLTVPGFKYFNAASISVESDTPALVATDGELLGTTPCAVEMVPAVLKARCSMK